MKNQLRKLLSLVAIFAIALVITNCSKQEELVLPDLPTLATKISTIDITRGAVTTFEVTIAAPGKFRELNATAEKGTAVLSNIVGVGTESATATVTYTAPPDLGTTIIHIKAIDKSAQNVGRDITVNVSQAPPTEVAGGDVEGEWGPYVTINVNGSVTVPEGKTLVIREGTNVVMNGESLNFNVDGNFYSLGSEKYPNKFTVATEPATVDERFNHVWMGVKGSATAESIVTLYTTFQYVGDVALSSVNPEAKIIMQNCTAKFTKNFGVIISGGEVLINNNTFLYNGEVYGGGGISVSNAAKGDIAYNVFIGSTGNAVYSDGANMNIYNNTAVECGDSFTVRNGSTGYVYDNLVANCGYGVLFPKAPSNPDLKAKAGYTFYFADNDEDVKNFYPTDGSLVKGDGLLHDIAGNKGDNDPLFVKRPTSEISLTPDYDLTLVAATKAGDPTSPAFGKGFTNFLRNFDSHIVGGVTYTTPLPSSTIGATTKAPATTP